MNRCEKAPQKGEARVHLRGRIFSTKTGIETGRRNLYPIYILSVPQSLPRVAEGQER